MGRERGAQAPQAVFWQIRRLETDLLVTMDNLGGFDPTTMTYFSTQLAHPNSVLGGETYQDVLLPLDMPDQHSAYGYAPWVHGQDGYWGCS